jgi:hypothetical protein
VEVVDAGFQAFLEGYGVDSGEGDGIGQEKHVLGSADGTGLRLAVSEAGREDGRVDDGGSGGIRDGAYGRRRARGRTGKDRQFVTFNAYFHSSPSFHEPSI